MKVIKVKNHQIDLNMRMFSFHISYHLQFVFLLACHKLFTQPLKLKM